MVVRDHSPGAKFRSLVTGVIAMAEKVGSSISSGKPSGGLRSRVSKIWVG